jgi:hypothetical protein
MNREKVKCDDHSSGYETWVCTHLYSNPAQSWFSREATTDNPWPDAWCSECDKIFMRDGEWNDKNSGCTQIKLICNFCYENRRKQEVAGD